MSASRVLGLAAILIAAGPAVANAQSAEPASKAFTTVDEIFADYALDNHIPGLVYGIVADGKLVYVRGIGVQDLESKRPVTADTLFRIASMTKAFTALTVLKLRDEGKLQLDAPAETYVEEMRGWKYPTLDSPRIRVRDLLNHTAGFVTDDPWGDRQTPMAEAEFSRLLREGVPFTRPPATAWEYSNLGYALLGRIITNVSGHPYADTITADVVEAARHGVLGLRRRCRAARASRARVSLGRRRVGASSRRWRTARSARWAASRPVPTTTPDGSPIYCPPGRRVTKRTPDL